MIFAYLLLFAALTLEGLGSFVAILGFADKAGPILIAILITLDVIKILLATALYKYWKLMSWAFKIFLIPAVLVLISFTSGGAFGYVSKEFTAIMLPQEENKIELQALVRERQKLEDRKKEIDEQIKAVPNNAPTARRRLMESFAPESETLNSRITQLDIDIPAKEKEISQFTTDGGTILSVSKTLDIPPEKVIKYFSALITLFLDPLAIIILTLANFLIAHKREIKKLNVDTVSLEEKVNVEEKNININKDIETLNSTQVSNIDSNILKEKEKTISSKNNISYHYSPENNNYLKSLIKKNDLIDSFNKENMLEITTFSKLEEKSFNKEHTELSNEQIELNETVEQIISQEKIDNYDIYGENYDDLVLSKDINKNIKLPTNFTFNFKEKTGNPTIASFKKEENVSKKTEKKAFVPKFGFDFNVDLKDLEKYIEEKVNVEEKTNKKYDSDPI